MPVLDAVQTFAGIANENEFYSHHYLAEVFKGDIKAKLDAWEAAEADHPSAAADHEQHRAPTNAYKPGRKNGLPCAASSTVPKMTPKNLRFLPSCKPACCKPWATPFITMPHSAR